MTYVNLATGAFLIVLGFLVKKYPNLIAGYNTMSEEQKKNVDIDGLSTFVRNSLLIMGLLVAAGPYVVSYLGFPGLAVHMMWVGVLGVLPFLMLKAGRCTLNSRSTTGKSLTIIILVLAATFVVSLIIYGTSTPILTMHQKTLTVSGMYGDRFEVASIELSPDLPPIALRTNGFHFNHTSKGNFQTADGHAVKLFTQSKEGPFIRVVLKGAQIIYINREMPTETRQLYDRMANNMTY